MNSDGPRRIHALCGGLIMPGRRFQNWKWYVVGVGVFLGVAGVVLWLAVPYILRSTLREQMERREIEPIRTTLPEVGLHSVQISNWAGSGSNFTMRLDEATARFQPGELWRGRIGEFTIDGMETEVTLASGERRNETTGLVDLSNGWLSRLTALPKQLRLGLFRATNVVLRLRREDRSRSVYLSGNATNRDNRELALTWMVSGEELTGQGTAKVDSRGASMHLGFRFDELRPWASLVSGFEWPDPLADLEVAPIVGEFDLSAMTNRGSFAVSGRFEPVALRREKQLFQFESTAILGTVLPKQDSQITLRTALPKIRFGGLDGSIEHLTAEVDPSSALEMRAEGLEVRGGEGVRMRGGLQMEMALPRRPAAEGWRGRLEVSEFRLPRLEITPFEMDFSGSPVSMTGTVANMTIRSDAELPLTNLTMRVKRGGSGHPAVQLMGSMEFHAATNLTVLKAVPFTANWEFGDPEMRGWVGWEFTNHAFRLPGLSKEISLSGDFHAGVSLPQPTLESITMYADWGLTVDEMVGAGVQARQLELHGRIDSRSGVTHEPDSGGRLLPDLIPVSGTAAKILAKARLHSTLAAANIVLPGKLTLKEVSMSLTHVPYLRPVDAAPWGLDLEARSLSYRGILLQSPRLQGAIRPETIGLLAGARFQNRPLSMQGSLHPKDPKDPATPWQGDMQVGPIAFDDFALPGNLLPPLAGVRLSGSLTVQSPIQITALRQLTAQPSLHLNFPKITWPDKKISLEHLETEIQFISLKPLVTQPDQIVTAQRIQYADYEAGQIRFRLHGLESGDWQVELRNAEFLGGTLRSEPLLLHPTGGDFDLELILEGIELNRLAALFPQFDGKVEGLLDGKIPLERRNGTFRLGNGFLALSPSRPAHLQYNAEGLLTQNVPSDSKRYEQLKLVEQGMKNLALEKFRLKIADPADSPTPIQLHFEGTSASSRAIVPIVFNLNIRGDLQNLMGLLSRRNLEFSFH